MQYDIIIAGGGMVGSTSLVLGNAGKRVAVLEAHTAPFAATDPYDLRVSAISRA